MDFAVLLGSVMQRSARFGFHGGAMPGVVERIAVMYCKARQGFLGKAMHCAAESGELV